jgi:uncharacterized protein with HEPN domain
MSRSDRVYPLDILHSIEIIIKYTDHKTEFDFLNDQMLQDAVIRRFEIIGEASSKISQQLKNQNPGIQWQVIKGMRNKLIHEYFGVLASTLFSTIKLDLPILKQQIETIVN